MEGYCIVKKVLIKRCFEMSLRLLHFGNIKPSFKSYNKRGSNMTVV